MEVNEEISNKLCKFFGGTKDNIVTFFDTETNGLPEKDYKPVIPPPSTLSVSFVKVAFDGIDNPILLGAYNRFYYPNPDEEYDEKAIGANGLTEEVITKKRKKVGESYPRYFKDDYKTLLTYLEGTKLYVSHNIDFDRIFVPCINWSDPGIKTFCTMRSNTELMKLPLKRYHPKYKYKSPKLSEAAEYYGVDTSEKQFHDSSFDTKICFKVFLKMLENTDIRLRKLRRIEGEPLIGG